MPLYTDQSYHPDSAFQQGWVGERAFSQQGADLRAQVEAAQQRYTGTAAGFDALRGQLDRDPRAAQFAGSLQSGDARRAMAQAGGVRGAGDVYAQQLGGLGAMSADEMAQRRQAQLGMMQQASGIYGTTVDQRMQQQQAYRDIMERYKQQEAAYALARLHAATGAEQRAAGTAGQALGAAAGGVSAVAQSSAQQPPQQSQQQSQQFANEVKYSDRRIKSGITRATAADADRMLASLKGRY